MSEPGSSQTASGRSTPDPQRPPLPPRPNEFTLLQSRPGSGYDSRPSPQRTLTADATTAVSLTDVNSFSKPDGSRDIQASLSRRTSIGTLNRHSSTRNSDKDDDNLSIRSPILFPSTPAESGSIFGDGLLEGKDRVWTEGVHEEQLDADVDFAAEFEDVATPENDEDIILDAWKAKKKHFIILSAAGKPIYTRHGSDSLISSYVGIIQTIISFYMSVDNQLRSFTAGGTKFVILSQTNLYLVAISTLHESESQLRGQLDALYMQILSTLTLPTLTHIFSIRPSSDLRRPLQGTEVLLSSLVDSFTRGSPSTLLSALECLKIRKSHRSSINSTFLKSRVDDLLYGLIVAGGRLVSVIRPKKHSLHPSDLQLIFNMLFEAEGVKAGGGDSWIPICLPGFNNTGYLYMYVSFLDMRPGHTAEIHELEPDEQIAKEDAVAIVLLSVNRESFDSLRSMKNYIVQDLNRTGSMRVIQSAIYAGRPTVSSILPATPLRHFLYKSKPNVQFVMASYLPYFETLNQRRQLLSVYHTLHASVHARHGAAAKVHHSVSPTSTALAWSTPIFELYCVAGPLTPRNALAQAANKVVQWVQREEERIFIIGGAVF